jgi:formiminoglutamase
LLQGLVQRSFSELKEKCMYVPVDMKQWHGRVDTLDGELGKRWHQIVSAFHTGFDHVASDITLIGFACDAGVARNHGRVGASGGPAAIRTALGNMPVHGCRSIADAGDVSCEPAEGGDGLEEAQQELAAQLACILAGGSLPIALGGGHEIAYASFSGIARHLEQQENKPRIGVINLDAHFDLRMADRASSGTPFRQIAEDCAQRGWDFHYCCLGVSRFANTQALFERARELKVTWRLDEDMGLLHHDEVLATLNDFLAGVDHVYFTTCLDVLPAAVAPGVSAPAARGVSLELIEAIADAVAGSSKLLLADIAEMNPAYDIDQRTARVAARLVARIAEASVGARK